ncbi:uncharacterized protein GJ701_016900 [Geothlypis trichas]
MTLQLSTYHTQNKLLRNRLQIGQWPLSGNVSKQWSTAKRVLKTQIMLSPTVRVDTSLGEAPGKRRAGRSTGSARSESARCPVGGAAGKGWSGAQPEEPSAAASPRARSRLQGRRHREPRPPRSQGLNAVEPRAWEGSGQCGEKRRERNCTNTESQFYMHHHHVQTFSMVRKFLLGVFYTAYHQDSRKIHSCLSHTGYSRFTDFFIPSFFCALERQTKQLSLTASCVVSPMKNRTLFGKKTTKMETKKKPDQKTLQGHCV